LTTVVSKIKKRLSRWRRKVLSFAERVYLVKLVLTVISLHYMSIFKTSSLHVFHEIIKSKKII